MLENEGADARRAMKELIAAAKTQENDIIVLGASSSEVIGSRIGSAGSIDIAGAILPGLLEEVRQAGCFLAVQCCEHLNRSLIIEKKAMKLYGLTQVNAVPYEHAGGSFATEAYKIFDEPVAVESVAAKAGMDIGDTLIGMHIKPVCVPYRSSIKKIGAANLVLARSRVKFVGGERAHYDENLK